MNDVYCLARLSDGRKVFLAAEMKVSEVIVELLAYTEEGMQKKMEQIESSLILHKQGKAVEVSEVGSISKLELEVGDTVELFLVESDKKNSYSFCVKSLPFKKESGDTRAEKNELVDRETERRLGLEVGESVTDVYEDVMCENRVGQFIITNGNFFFKSYSREGKVFTFPNHLASFPNYSFLLFLERLISR